MTDQNIPQNNIIGETNRSQSVKGTQPDTWSSMDVFRISAGIILAFLAVIIGYRLYAWITLSQEAQRVPTTIWMSLGLGLMEGVVLIGCVYYLGLRRSDLTWADAGIRPITLEWVLKGAALGVLAIPLSGLIALAIQLVLDLPTSNPQIPFLAPEGFSWLGLFSMLLLGGIVAPFAEELYFRGVLYSWLRQRWGIHVAMLVSAFIFGIVHGNLAVAGAAFVLGIVLAWIYERSNSLWPAVLIHMINNSFKIVLLYTMLAYGLMPSGL